MTKETLPAAGPGILWILAALAFVAIVVMGVYVVSVALRKSLAGQTRMGVDDASSRQSGSENPAVFMSASVQAVIQRLREQEKELARLNQLERVRAEQTARLSEAVTRSMPTGLLLVNSNGLITLSNAAAEKALGRGGLAYRRYSEVFGADSALTRLLRECIEAGRTYQREEVEHITPSGEVRQLGLTLSPTLPGPLYQGRSERNERATGALCLLSDLTQLTALQKQIRLQENLAALGEMSAGIAHEFKNSLATISGYAQMIAAEAPAGEMADCARRIVEQTQSLTRVVTEFLRFARPLDAAHDAVSLRPLVERVAEEVNGAIPQVALLVEGDFSDLAGDESLLRQALLNLARNAAEAARENAAGGRVAIRGEVSEAGGESMLRISVADNGPGIRPGELHKLFLPFYTTKPEGTGLGLAVVQKIVLQHGGRVEARNQPSGGAEFTVWLPIRRTLEPQAVESASPSI